MRMTSGGREVDVGRGGRGGGSNCQNNALGNLFEHSITVFWTPDISMIETTHLDL